MASKFWVGGGSSTNWNATGNTNWSLTSGGANNAAVPVAGDDVFFDANSGTAGCVMNVGTANLNSFNMTGCPAGFTLSGSGGGIVIVPASGTVTVLLGGTFTFSNVVQLRPASGATINFTSAGNHLAVTQDSGTGTVQQQDNLYINQQGNGFTITGTWVANSHNITLAGQTTGSINSGAWINNGTFTAGTGTVTFDGTNPGANLWGTANANFYNLSVVGNAGNNAQLSIQSNQTVTNSLVGINGNTATVNRLLVTSKVIGTQVKLTVPAGTTGAAFSNVDFQDMDVALSGGGQIDLSAITGLSGDCGGNNAADMKLTAGQTNCILATSGGLGAMHWSLIPWSLGRQPLPQDNVIASGAFSSGNQIQFDGPRIGKNIDFTGFTVSGSPTITSTGGPTVVWYGNIAMPAGLNGWAGSNSVLRNGTYTWNFGGLTSSAALAPTLINANLSLTNNLTFTGSGGLNINGDATSTFNDNGYAVSLVIFTAANSSSGFAITISGQWTLTGSATVWNMIAGVTLTATGSVIAMNNASASAKTFAGAGKTYGNLLITGAGTGGWTFTGANTFADIRDNGTAAHTITFPGSATTTCTTFHVTGTSGHLITLASSAGTATIATASGIVSCDFLSISNITISGATTAYAGANSTNGGGNTGWTFTAAANATGYTLVGPGSGYYQSAQTFYVDLNGPSSGSTTITPATSGTGTFSPTSVTFTNGQGPGATQTFTYTPTSKAGSPHSISVTNNNSLTNPSADSFTVNAVRLTVTAVQAAKRSDGTTTALTWGGGAAVPTITQGALQGSDTANFTQSYASAAAGTQKTLTPAGTVTDGNSGNNYSYTFTSVATGVILSAASVPALPTLSWPSGFSDWLDVTKAPYNADPTGVVDATTALQQALDDMTKPGGSFALVRKAVYLPAGTYTISSTLTLHGDGATQNSYGFRIIGNGGATTIKWSGAAGGTMLSITNAGYHELWSFVLDGNGLAGIGLDYDTAFTTACKHWCLGFKNVTNTTGGFGIATYLRTGSGAVADSIWVNCQWQNNRVGVATLGFNVLDHLLYGCDFRGHSLYAINCVNGNLYVYNSHFELNAVDLRLLNAGGLGCSMRGCTSQGSGRLIDTTTAWVGVQDCWVDSWTGTYATGSPSITLHGLPVMVFDATWANPPSSDPPVLIQASTDILLYSQLTSAATSAVISNPLAAAKVYNAGTGAQVGVITGPTQTGFQTTWPVPKVVMNVLTYGASVGTGGDDTAAVQAACNDAESWAAVHGSGACVYFPNPSVSYKITSTIHLRGSNYTLMGGGWHCYLNWQGGDTVGAKCFWLDSVKNVTMHGFQFTGAFANAWNIYVSGQSICLLDRLWVNAVNGNSSATGPGIYLDSLPSGASVILGYVSGNVTWHDCGASKVLWKFAESARFVVDGTSAVTQGNVGMLVYDGGSALGAVTNWQINDGQSFVGSDIYVEQVHSGSTFLSTAGGKSNTLITISQAKTDVNSGATAFLSANNATANAPQITFLGINHTASTAAPFNLTNTGSGSILFVSGVGNMSVASNTPITLSGTVNTSYKGNTGSGAPADTSGGSDLANISTALDHLRLLRINLDTALADPLPESTVLTLPKWRHGFDRPWSKPKKHRVGRRSW